AKSTVALPYDMGLTSSAPHAENGKKLVQFLLSQPVQETVSSGALGIPVRSDVHPSDANATLLRQSLTGVDVYHPDWNKVLAELPADVAAYTAAIGS
ncbi:MAG: 2-aminoethylphosphonate ABC transporter substrate-binding protein, partial [Mycobacteriaceae bacterium]